MTIDVDQRWFDERVGLKSPMHIWSMIPSIRQEPRSNGRVADDTEVSISMRVLRTARARASIRIVQFRA